MRLSWRVEHSVLVISVTVTWNIERVLIPYVLFNQYER